jgi:two-component system sensor histidine kinase BarA
MSYRSIKRVLGETSLERKCRLLFGLCLFLLITGAFFLVDRIAGNLIITTTQNHGHDLVDIVMIKSHSVRFETDTGRESDSGSDDSNSSSISTNKRELLREIIADFEETQDYRYQVVTLNPDYLVYSINPVGPQDERERQLLIELEQKYEKWQSELAQDAEPGPEQITPDKALGKNFDRTTSRASVFVDRVPDEIDGEYHYFEPVDFKTSCRHCHEVAQDINSVSSTDIGETFVDEPPMFAVKVMIPYEKTRDAINGSRAILIAVAILTVFVAMIALYLIVRYVIVKPLEHLRDVSDNVSQGKLEVRADIHTNDEFEDLAHSFNRMLRHLTEAQGELRQVNKDLDSKVDELAQLNMRLYEMNRLKDDFLANMSHELRTPLNSIIGFSEVLQGLDALTDKQRRYAGNIQKSGRLLLEMINDILDLAKMEAGKMEVRPTEFNIGHVAQAQCDMVRSLAEDKNIDLETQVQSGLPPVYQDQSKVQQILTNLLSNAIKFTPEGGRIDVGVSRDDDGQLVLTVADTGVGIAEEDRDIIFEKFRQSSYVLGGDGLTREYSGTGLGLSILRELCRLLKGEITFDSELGQGSTFKVLLPWVCSDRGPHKSSLNARLHDLTSPNANEFTAPVDSAGNASSSHPGIAEARHDD